MKYLVIENKGEIAPEALFLMGASTKRDDSSKIGMFGTGNKFALAVLLREKIGVTIYSGQKKLVFGTTPVKLRDHSFDRVTVREGRKSPAQTNFTTEMGLGWDVEGAFRELVSNAYDEPQPSVYTTTHPEGREGYTRVVLAYTQQIPTLFKEFDRLFLFNRTPIQSGETFGGKKWAIYKKSGIGTRVYRRKVLVYETDEFEAAFDYEMDDIEISDERKASWSAISWELCKVFDGLDIEHKRVIFEYAQNSDTAEGKCDEVRYYLSSPEWREVARGLVVANRAAAELAKEDLSSKITEEQIAIVPEGWEEGLKKVGEITSVADVVGSSRLKGYKILSFDDLTDAQKGILTIGLHFMAKAEVGIPYMDFSVFSGPESAPDGEYLPDENKILLNVKVLDIGEFRTIKALLKYQIEKECFHTSHSVYDVTLGKLYELYKFKIDILQERIDQAAVAAVFAGAPLETAYA